MPSDRPDKSPVLTFCTESSVSEKSSRVQAIAASLPLPLCFVVRLFFAKFGNDPSEAHQFRLFQD
jgi:hypothetical protein